ncbi:MAG: tetratricopeptide repeat protein [Bacteroidota bacterium]
MLNTIRKWLLLIIWLCPLLSVAQSDRRSDSLLQVLDAQSGGIEAHEFYIDAFFDYIYSDPDLAYGMAEKLYQRAKVNNDNAGIASYTNLLGVANLETNHYDVALVNFLESIALSEKLGMFSQQASTLSNIAILYAEVDDYQQSIRYAKEAFDIYKLHTKDSAKMARIWNNLGTFYIRGGIYDSAFVYLDSAITYRRQPGMEKDLNNSIQNLGILKAKQQQWDEALVLLDSTRSYFEKIGFTLAVAENDLEQGSVYIAQKKYEQARQKLLPALDVFNSIKAYDFGERALKGLADLYYRTGDYEQSLIYYKQYQTLREEVVSAREVSEVARIKLQYEEEKRRNLMALASKEHELSLVWRNALIIGIVTIALILALTYYNLRTRYQRNKLRLEINQVKLEEKNKEVATVALQLTEKSSFLNEVVDKMNQAAKNAVPENKAFIRRVINSVKQHANLERDWETFQRSFMEINQDFYDKIKAQYPNVSPNDLKLCALLRLNFTSKEVASTLGLSTDGVKKARHRLRAKLNLNTEDNLVDFLMKL